MRKRRAIKFKSKFYWKMKVKHAIKRERERGRKRGKLKANYSTSFTTSERGELEKEEKTNWNSGDGADKMRGRRSGHPHRIASVLRPSLRYSCFRLGRRIWERRRILLPSGSFLPRSIFPSIRRFLLLLIEAKSGSH